MGFNYTAQCSPPLSPSLWIFSIHIVFVSVFYVVSLYAMVPADVRALPRSSGVQVAARIKSVCVSTLLLLFVYFPFSFCRGSDAGGRQFLAYESLQFPPVLSHPLPLLHVMVLFLGPLSIIFLSAWSLLETSTSARGWTIKDALHHVLVVERGLPATPNIFGWSPERLRDLVVGPITEELCYRALLVPYMLVIGVSPVKCIFVAPVFFGFAHVHHAINRLRSGDSVSKTLLVTTVQFSYTYLFGAYATYALLVTNDVSSAVACHSFCNFMGLPTLPSRGDSTYIYRRWVYFFYAVGLVGFVLGFFVLGDAKRPIGALGELAVPPVVLPVL